jgi:hypothetical protein
MVDLLSREGLADEDQHDNAADAEPEAQPEAVAW